MKIVNTRETDRIYEAIGSNAQYGNKFNLNRHMKNEHEKSAQGNFKCTICARELSSKQKKIM